MYRVLIALTVVGLNLALPNAAHADCRSVHGQLAEYVVSPFASPNDPLGRTVTTSNGTINSIGTAILTTVGPGPTPGTLGATTRHLFLVSEGDQLTALGVAVFTPIAGSRDVTTTLTLTITGGTGEFAGTTGTIIATGVGFNFFPLPPGPSSANESTFVYKLSGELCT